MSAKVTRLRSPLLTNAISRPRLGHRAEPVFEALHATIDQLGNLYDGLDGVRENQSPLKTAEQNALDYRAKYDRARGRAEQLVKAQMQKLIDHQIAVETAANRSAGIHQDPALGQEIRAALRGMTQEARDRAIVKAFEAGEPTVIAAVIHSPTAILTGEITAPVKTLTEQFVEKANPGLRADLNDTESALEILGLAWDSYQKATADLRDKGAETRGEAGDAAAREAEATLAKALA